MSFCWRRGPVGEGGARRALRHDGRVRRVEGEKKEAENCWKSGGGRTRLYTLSNKPDCKRALGEHAGLSVDEAMSLLARFRVSPKGHSAPWLSLGTGVNSPLQYQILGSISSGIFVFLSNECLRQLFWDNLTSDNVTATFCDL